MATFIMLPDGVTGTNQWQNALGGTAAATDVDNDNGATQYARSIGGAKEWTLTFADPSVDESAIASITSVSIITSAKYNTTSVNDVNLKFTMGGTDGSTTISNGTTTTTVEADDSFNVVSSAIESNAIQHLSGNTAWSYSLLEALNCKLVSFGTFAFRKQLHLSYVYASVSYVPQYPNKVIGVDSGDISEINGVATANISKVSGV